MVSSYPDIEDNSRLGEQRKCDGAFIPGCRVYYIPKDDSSAGHEVKIDEWKDGEDAAARAKEQVMVFKYRGVFRAVDHVCAASLQLLLSSCWGCDARFLEIGDQRELEAMVLALTLHYQECPHSSYPLSNATPFDIEDFGVRLSAGITCPKHDWSFDVQSGSADRGSYRLRIWEVDVRDTDGEQFVWVRRKNMRIG